MCCGKSRNQKFCISISTIPVYKVFRQMNVSIRPDSLWNQQTRFGCPVQEPVITTLAYKHAFF